MPIQAHWPACGVHKCGVPTLGHINICTPHMPGNSTKRPPSLIAWDVGHTDVWFLHVLTKTTAHPTCQAMLQNPLPGPSFAVHVGHTDVWFQMGPL
ncbi:hypothetical protein AMECASPLE_025888 [Ameca splendens]|uniref:Uncharacterized protein n=1 Tax=Ameca splendens TaxID=208324 RepID=A0ABV0XHR7_9TELE